MNTYALANSLNSTTDVEFAETFAYYYKMRRGIYEEGLKQEDMDFNIHEMVEGVENSLNEIIYSETMDSSAWWKDDKFFGRDTPKAKFLAQEEVFKESRLMESAIAVNNIYRRMENDREIETGSFSGDILQEITALAREFEYEFYDTDEYVNDYLDVLEKWLPKKLRELFPSKEQVTMIVYLSDIISNYNGDDNLTEITLSKNDAMDWFYDLTTIKTDKSFTEWLESDYSADDTIGLYGWLIKNNRYFTVAGNLKR